MHIDKETSLNVTEEIGVEGQQVAHDEGWCHGCGGQDSTNMEHTFVEKYAGGDELSTGKEVGDAQVALKDTQTCPMRIKIPVAKTRTPYMKSTCNRVKRLKK
ncbi:hypothetical protein Adt_39619 [Abeliophyllum distichum]|uniref:Uncharacterized protein n=1 Tax=Abeliophyllum distichum TaxID=126358 RepID=A0ABD1Q5K5_9LAMI